VTFCPYHLSVPFCPIPFCLVNQLHFILVLFQSSKRQKTDGTQKLFLFMPKWTFLFIHSFTNLYSASSRKLLRGTPNSSMVKKKSLEMIIECIRKCPRYSYILRYCRANCHEIKMFALWQHQSKAWIKEEDDANHLCYDKVSLHRNLHAYIHPLIIITNNSITSKLTQKFEALRNVNLRNMTNLHILLVSKSYRVERSLLQPTGDIFHHVSFKPSVQLQLF